MPLTQNGEDYLRNWWVLSKGWPEVEVLDIQLARAFMIGDPRFAYGTYVTFDSFVRLETEELMVILKENVDVRM